MDLGIYLVYAAVAWFGVPVESHYFARKISTGVDGLGTAILRYDHFDVTIQAGKIGDSFLSSEIYFDSGTLLLDGINSISKAEFHDRSHQQIERISLTAEENPMVEEAADFANVIENPNDRNWGLQYEEWVELARNVNRVLTYLRKDAGIVFEADKK